MKKIIGVISYKGGVGVTTVCAGIGKELGACSEKVCVVDCKIGGTLDIALKGQDGALFGFDDLCRGMELSRVATRIGKIDFCASPFEKVLDHSGAYLGIKNSDYDYIVLDQPSDHQVCNEVVIVTTLEASSIRAAERLSFELQEKGIDCTLAVNRFGEHENTVSVERAIDLTHTRLAGVIPYVEGLGEADTSFEKDNAILNITKRLLGNSVPVFEGSKKKSRLKKMLGVK